MKNIHSDSRCKVNFFGLGDAYWYIENCESTEDAIKKMEEDWKEAIGQLTQDDRKEIRNHFHLVLYDFIDRHNAPWASEGIKKELIHWRYPISQEEIFKEFITSFHQQYTLKLIIKYGIKTLAEKITNGEIFDTSYQGNFAGYDPKRIEKVLIEHLNSYKC